MAMPNRRKRKHKQDDNKVVIQAQLDRFAGSSDEDDGGNEGGEDSEDEVVAGIESSTGTQVLHMLEASAGINAVESERSHGGVDYEKDDAVDEEDHLKEDDDRARDDEEFAKWHEKQQQEGKSGQGGMADAMARILGTSVIPKSSQSVVLSKTRTPLQKLAEQERLERKELRDKRKTNRDRNLAALHIPLSVATTANVATSGDELKKELEQERMHRRVATRGVVALFNAIAQHQNAPCNPSVPVTADSPAVGKTEVKKMTKHSFLDMIKSKAIESFSKREKDAAHVKPVSNNPKPTTPQWSALKDDYMAGAAGDVDDDSVEESARGGSGQKASKGAKKATKKARAR